MKIEIFVVKTEIELENDGGECKYCMTEQEFRQVTFFGSCEISPIHNAHKKEQETFCYWLNRNDAQKELDLCKEDLIKLFGGLTEIKPFRGYERKGTQIITDFGEIWVIYIRNPESIADPRFKSILLDIKAQTRQKTQVYAVNNDLYSL